jgi:hypothetical protein
MAMKLIMKAVQHTKAGNSSAPTIICFIHCLPVKVKKKQLLIFSVTNIMMTNGTSVVGCLTGFSS